MLAQMLTCIFCTGICGCGILFFKFKLPVSGAQRGATRHGRRRALQPRHTRLRDDGRTKPKYPAWETGPGYMPVYTHTGIYPPKYPSCGGRLDQNDTARCVYHHRAQAAIFRPITSDGHRSRHWHLNPTSSHPLTLTFLFLVYLQGLDGRSREPPNLIDVPSRGHGDELPAFLEMLDDWPRRLLVRPEAF